ncbi:MAG: glycosyltransferase family 2 protein [Ruminococcus flavefaciens]|nr:glycosyltransferase family 2 protein [Ruminococcus flavefaciens]
MNSIVAIVVTYNRKEYLKECIAALKASETPVDILIVDNASSDGTKAAIQYFIDKKTVFYLNTGKNLGGAGGYNLGLKKAYELGYEYFWLMDDDTIVHPDSLTELINAKVELSDNFGFLSSLVLWVDGSGCRMNSPRLALNWIMEASLFEKGIIRLSGASFVSFFLRREVVKEVGLPIKDYFIWGDDSEYSARISETFPCYFVTNSKVTHKMKSNDAPVGLNEMTDLQRIKRMAYSIRNHTCTYKRLGCEPFLKWTCSLIKLFIKVIFSKNPYKIKKMFIIIKSYFNGLIFFNPDIEFID